MPFFFFFFFHFVRREGDGRGGQAEQPDGLVFEGTEEGGVCAHRIAPTHTPIKSIRIVRDGKKTGNHCKK